MITAGIFDVGGVLHKNGVFPPEDALEDFILSDSVFQKEYVYHEVYAILALLQASSIQLAVVSNTIPQHVKYLTKNGIYRPFRVQVFSYAVEVRKPDPKIYKITLEKLAVKPEEAFYVDDSEDNVAAAKALGMHTIHFTTAAQLKTDLKKIGVIK